MAWPGTTPELPAVLHAAVGTGNDVTLADVAVPCNVSSLERCTASMWAVDRTMRAVLAEVFLDVALVHADDQARLPAFVGTVDAHASDLQRREPDGHQLAAIQRSAARRTLTLALLEPAIEAVRAEQMSARVIAHHLTTHVGAQLACVALDVLRLLLIEQLGGVAALEAAIHEGGQETRRM